MDDDDDEGWPRGAGDVDDHDGAERKSEHPVSVIKRHTTPRKKTKRSTQKDVGYSELSPTMRTLIRRCR